MKCAAGYIRLGSNCVEECGDGFYIDSNRECKDCGKGCKTCTSPFSCSACFDTSLSPISGTCEKRCPPSTILNANGECACTLGVLTASGCSSSCPPGTYNLNRVCQPCSYPCATCAGSSTTCLSCATGFTYISGERRCVAQSNCNYGQFENAQGNCVPICSNGVFYKTACIVSCPSGFRNNGFGGCVESSSNICQSGLFQQGTNCVSVCSNGYFTNMQQRICEPCPANCQTCSSPNQCTICSNGFGLNS